MAAAAPNGEAQTVDDLSTQAPKGVILPPKSVREFIEKASSYVVRNGAVFEERLRQGSHKFVDPDDPYNAYYKWRLDEQRAGRGLDVEGTVAPKTDVTFQGREKEKAPEKPEEFKFSARMPTINSEDLDVVRLTALWAAKNGKAWVTALSQRRAGEAAFDFLRPQHSLNMFFNRMVEQYKELLEGDVVDNGNPQKKRVEELTANFKDRFHLLDRAKQRAEYAKYQETQKVEKEEKAEKERIAFAQIDWHDFVVVETIEFDERDDNVELPPPMSKNDLMSKSLEQKAAMRIGADRRLEEAVPDFDYEQMKEVHPQPAAAQLPSEMFVDTADIAALCGISVITYTVSRSPSPAQAYPPPPLSSYDQDTSRVVSLQAERDRVRAAQEAARGTQQPTRIRNDYVPQAQRRKQAQNTSICPNCKQAIPNEEMEAHMRIEMLDPRWREQSRINQQRSSTTNLATADVANNLKRLASQRTDVFDPVTGQTLSEDEQNRRKRLEMESAAVGTNLPYGMVGQQLPPGMPSGTDKPDVQEQIRALHERYKK